MARVLTNCHIYTGTREILNGYLRFSDHILGVGEMAAFQPSSHDDVISLSGDIVVPGFIDVHVHGGYGIDSMTNTATELSHMVTKMRSEGVTGVLLTTMTQSPSRIRNAMVTIRQAAIMNPAILGIHLEGPFVSPKFNGAQPRDQIQPASISKLADWQRASGNRVKLLTYAPELSRSARFERYCQENGIHLAVGHSDARFDDLEQCQINHVTHLFNAQRGLHQREPGVVGYAMLNRQSKVELVCDGFHVVSPVVKIAYQIIGPDRLELVTDAMEAKGMPTGQYQLGGQPVAVKNGRATLSNGHLAGSVLTYDNGFRNMIQFTGCSIADAVKMTSTNQAREFRLNGKGSLELGSDADLNVFDKHLSLMATYSCGK